jgi:hypothetical protein
MIRVNHAGEFGANRIYAGQMSVLGDSSVGSSIKVLAVQLLAKKPQWLVLWQWRRLWWSITIVN